MSGQSLEELLSVSFNKYGHGVCHWSLGETRHPIRCRRRPGFRALTGSQAPAGAARLCLPGLGAGVGEKPGEHSGQTRAGGDRVLPSP